MGESTKALEDLRTGTLIFDEMHSMCSKCGSTNREHQKLIAGNDKVYAARTICLDCGWEL